MHLPFEGAGGILPPVIGSIRCYGGTFYHADADLPHPVAFLNKSWNTVLHAIATFLNVQEQLPAPGKIEPGRSLELALEAYRSTIYALVEFNEGMVEGMQKCLAPKGASVRLQLEGTRGLRAHMKTVCNKLKHDHRRLAWVSAETMLGVTHGFVVVAPSGDDAVIPDRDLHKKINAFSYPLHLKRLLSDTYAVAAIVAREIDRIGPSTPPSFADPDSSLTRDILRRVASLKTIPFEAELKEKVPILEVDAKGLTIASEGGKKLPILGGMIRWAQGFEGDGVTRTFPLVGQFKP